MTRLRECRYLAGLLLVALPAVPASAAELTPAEERGRIIFLEGRSPSNGEITAVINDTELPATMMPCGGCHGHDGRGRPEGGISPSDLTWDALTKPYGVEHPSGRRHPPYTERTLKRAFTMGIDSAGNDLHVAMPRYRLSLADAADLIAFVKRLGESLDPGISDDTIRLATILPREGPAASLGRAVESVLRARFDDVNKKGGIYHRRIELRVVDAPRDAEERATALRRQLDTEETFALVGAFLAGAEAQVAAVARDSETPLVGPLTTDPHIDFFTPNPWVFYLLPGLEDVARTLVTFADRRQDAELVTTAVLRSGDEHLDASARAIVERASSLGWPVMRTLELDDADVRAMRDDGIDRVFLLTPRDRQAVFFRRAADIGWFPEVLLPGTLAGRDIFEISEGFAGRLFAAYPTSPSGRDLRGLRTYRELAERHDLPADHLAAQLATLAAAEVLIEGLERTGRDLSRAGLVEALEGLIDLETGLLPPVSYGPNHRVGIRGAYVVAVDLERRTLEPAGDWIRSR